MECHTGARHERDKEHAMDQAQLTICSSQRFIGYVIVRWAYPAAGKKCAAVANKLTQAQRGCRNVFTVVADNFNTHKIHAPTAIQAAVLSSSGSRVGSFALNKSGSTSTASAEGVVQCSSATCAALTGTKDVKLWQYKVCGDF